MANTIMLDGTVFQPEARKTKKGTTVFSFNLSHYNGKEADGAATYFSRRVKVFKDLAENASRELKERDRVAVVGTEHQDVYTGKDGQKKYFDYIIANDIYKNPISRYTKDSGKNTGTVGSDIASDYIGDDEVPF